MIYSILIGTVAGMATGIGLVAVYSAVGLEAQIPMRSNTEGFEKWRVDDCKMQERARKMRGVVA